MIKASIDTLIPVCEKLFNSIRNQGTMPQTWCAIRRLSATTEGTHKITLSV